MNRMKFTYLYSKTYLGLVLSIVYFVMACDSPSANDCFKSSGDEVEQFVQLSQFSKVTVGRGVEAFIKQGEMYSIRIVSGENLIDDVIFEIQGDRLIVSDETTCNFVRSYGLTKVYITTPILSEIRSSTQFDINSQGILNFPELTFVSENFNISDTLPLADFNIRLVAESLTIVSNNGSNFNISGSVDQLSVGFFSGLGRFEGEELEANYVQISHRGSNDIVVNPQISIEGIIRGTGDVIAVNRPSIINVQELYTGQLIIND